MVRIVAWKMDGWEERRKVEIDVRWRETFRWARGEGAKSLTHF